MKMSKRQQGILDWVVMFFAAIVYSFGVSLFLNPNALAPGGVSGIAIIINYLTDLPTGMMIVLINIPLMIAGCFVIGKWFLIKSIYAIAVSSFFIDLWPKVIPSYVPITDDKLLAALCGALCSAIGMGFIFRCGGSTGGTDIVAKLLRRRFRSIKTGRIFLIVDSMIVISSVFATHQLENALYAGVCLFVCSFVLDKILYGTDEAKLLLIISSFPERVAEVLMRDVDAGVTFASGEGAYTGTEKKIIICAIKKPLFHRAKDLICKEDPGAFMIVSDAAEVFGEGYKLHGGDEL